MVSTIGGVAGATFTANNAVGCYTVTATVSGVSTPASFSLTNTAAPTVSMSASPLEGGTATGGGSYAEGVTAIPDSGYSFVNWTENGTQVSTSPSYTFPMGATAR